MSDDHELGKCLITRRGVVASHKSIMATCVKPDLMQAPRVGAIGVVSISITQEVLKMQHYPFVTIEIPGEGVQSFRRTTFVKDGVTNFEGKIVNMLRVVTIFRAIVSR